MSIVRLENPSFNNLKTIATRLVLEQLRQEVKELRKDLRSARKELAEKEAYGAGLAADLAHVIGLLNTQQCH